MKTPKLYSLKDLFDEDKEFIKLISDNPKLMDYYVSEVVRIYRLTFTSEHILIEYYKWKTGIKTFNNLTVLEIIDFSKFLTFAKHCPDVQKILPGFKEFIKKCPVRPKVSIDISKN